MFRSNNEIVDQMLEISITGNVVPQIWFKTLVDEKDRPQLLAIIILADIVYWYRPVEVRDEQTGKLVGYKKKFKGDLLQRGYAQIEEQFGVKTPAVRAALRFLEEKNVVRRVFRTITVQGQTLSNVLYLELCVDGLKKVTYPEMEDITDTPSYKILQEGVQDFVNGMNTTSIQKIETNRFSRADLENKLLMVDDDMDMGALPKTNYIKSIVTAECKMDVERKGIQSYQSLLYVRFLCFGNGALTARHDRSDGFYRRQIVLMTKDKPADRVDDPVLVERMLEEKEGIFLWCLEGLKRLILNNYRFSISDRARSNVESAVKDANNIIDFLKSEGYITFGPEEKSSTKALYEVYKEWCTDNAETPLGMRSFSYYLKTQGESYGIRDAGNNIYISKKKRCRGYKGVSVVDPTLIPPF